MIYNADLTIAKYENLILIEAWAAAEEIIDEKYLCNFKRKIFEMISVKE
jgi:hypothetical protein